MHMNAIDRVHTLLKTPATFTTTSHTHTYTYIHTLSHHITNLRHTIHQKHSISHSQFIPQITHQKSHPSRNKLPPRKPHNFHNKLPSPLTIHQNHTNNSSSSSSYNFFPFIFSSIHTIKKH